MQGRYESGLAAAVNWTAAAEHMCADVSLSPHQRNSSEHNAHHQACQTPLSVCRRDMYSHLLFDLNLPLPALVLLPDLGLLSL